MSYLLSLRRVRAGTLIAQMWVMTRLAGLLTVLPFAIALNGCSNEEKLTADEAEESLLHLMPASAAENLTDAAVDLSLQFAPGDSPEKATFKLMNGIGADLPCAQVSVDGLTLTVEYGVNPGNCEYRRHTFSGTSSMTVRENESGETVLDQVWTGLSDGVVRLDGTVTVNPNYASSMRHVVHDLVWEVLATGRTSKGVGERRQWSSIDGSTSSSGTQRWSDDSGTWQLDMYSARKSRFASLPEFGGYWLTSPSNREVGIGFSRLDAGTIVVTVERGELQFHFTARELGQGTEN
jgi:hypothetical protein